MDLEELTPSQEQLLQLMMDISDEVYRAVWMQGIEYDLWHSVELGYRDHGFIMSSSEIEQLKSLSMASGGWFYFDNKDGPSINFISTEDWKKKYDDFVRRNGRS